MHPTQKEMTDEELTEDIQHSIDQALNGKSSSEDEIREAFSEC